MILEKDGEAETLTKINEKEYKAIINITLMVLCISLLYIFCTTPYSILVLLRYYSKDVRLFGFFKFSFNLLLMPRVLNMFIYILFNKVFRKSLFKLLKKLFHYKHQQQSMTNQYVIQQQTELVISTNL